MTGWTGPYDERPDPYVPDPEATDPSSATCTLRTVPRARSEPHHEGDPRVGPRKANPHELVRRERRRAGG
jgi:hypothetical protein